MITHCSKSKNKQPLELPKMPHSIEYIGTHRSTRDWNRENDIYVGNVIVKKYNDDIHILMFHGFGGYGSLRFEEMTPDRSRLGLAVSLEVDQFESMKNSKYFELEVYVSLAEVHSAYPELFI